MTRVQRGVGLIVLLVALAATRAAAAGSGFRFDRDTFSFTNSTVFEYRDGLAQTRTPEAKGEKTKRYTRRCFVMTRSSLQFFKFARFDAKAPAVNDAELARRIRLVTRQQPWQEAWTAEKRVVFPGYRDLRQLSEAHTRTLQDNLGLGWPVYGRVGNFRMFFRHDDIDYQVKTHENLERTMAAGGFFAVYLSDYPHFRINHAVLVYGRRPARKGSDVDHYIVYDPNHPDGPRELKWSNSLKVFNFQKDKEFPGGFTKVYQVYGKWMQ